MTSGCDDYDSNLPSLPVFLPLVQRMMTTAIGWPTGWQETSLGENWVESSFSTKFSVQMPGAAMREVSADAKMPNALPNPIELGTTRLDGIGQAIAGDVRLYRGFATPSIDRKQELSKTLLAPEELGSIAKSAGASLHNDAGQWLDKERSNSIGKELWTWFWLGLLAMFLAEIFLQQSLSPRRSQSATTSLQSPSLPSSKRGAA
jgi:hypothetical protein